MKFRWARKPLLWTKCIDRKFLLFPKTLLIGPEPNVREETRWLEWAWVTQEYGIFGWSSVHWATKYDMETYPTEQEVYDMIRKLGD